MPDSLNEVFWTASSIAEQWKNDGYIGECFRKENCKDLTVKELGDKIAKKFGRICENYLGAEKGQLKWYQSRSENGGYGKYLFGDRAPELMKDLFMLHEKTKGCLLEDEKKQVCGCLAGLIPYFRRMEEVNIVKAVIKLSDKEWEPEKHSLLNGTPGFDEPGFMTKIINDSEIEEIMDKSSNIKSYQQQIKELLDRYYIQQEMGEVFHYRIFVESNVKKRKLNCDFYWYQYGLIRKWADKWYFIMDNAGAVRRAERFECTYEAFAKAEINSKEKKKFYETGKIPDSMSEDSSLEMDECLPQEKLLECLLEIYQSDRFSADNADARENISQLWKKPEIKIYEAGEISSKETCNAACGELVSCISGHILLKISKDDFMYMKRPIVKELEMIHEKAERRRQEIYYLVESGVYEPDIEMLRRVKMKKKEIEKRKRKTILDLKKNSQE